MNPELRSYLRLSAPVMPPEVAWPLMEKCADIEDLTKVPDDVLDTINKYLPGGVQISAQVQKYNKNHEPKGSSIGGQFASGSSSGAATTEKPKFNLTVREKDSDGFITASVYNEGDKMGEFSYYHDMANGSNSIHLERLELKKKYRGTGANYAMLDEFKRVSSTRFPYAEDYSSELLSKKIVSTMVRAFGKPSAMFSDTKKYKNVNEALDDLPLDTEEDSKGISLRGFNIYMKWKKGAHKQKADWNEAQHPREPSGTTIGGQFASGAVGPGTIDDFTKLPIGDRNAAFQKLTREHRDALADPRNTIPKRMDELLGEDRPFTNLHDYVASYADVLPADNQKLITAFMDGVYTDARAAGMSAEDALNMQHALTRMVIAQDYEAASRTLGDHGIHHLNGDVTMAKEILGVLTSNVNTPGNRLLMSVVAATHDMGYMTPPSRNFLDLDHPRWGQQYFNAHIGPIMEKSMGKDWVTLASTMIGAHDSPSLEWESHPERSAFSLSDNLALFHKEKMPPMLRHVPENINVLVKLADGKVDVASAKELMRANIDKAAYLTPKLKAAYGHAVAEVSGILPKFTLGMVGAHYKGVTWNKEANAVEVHMERGAANEGLAKVLDLGQRQFKKFAETYHSSADELVKSGQAKFYDPIKKKLILIAKLKTRKGDFFMALKRNLFG